MKKPRHLEPSVLCYSLSPSLEDRLKSQSHSFQGDRHFPEKNSDGQWKESVDWCKVPTLFNSIVVWIQPIHTVPAD